MAKRTGAETDICIGIHSTFGTAAALAGATKCLVSNFSQSRNVSVLRDSAIGSGNLMDGTDTQQGADSPTLNIDRAIRFNDSGMELLAQLFGTAAVTDMGDGAYVHSIVMNETANAKWATVAAGLTSTEVAEFPSCAVRGVTISADTFPGEVMGAFDLLANQRVITGTVNGTADLAGATVANTKRVIADKDDLFLFNAQAGAALSISDKKAVKSWSIALTRPQEHAPEMRGVAGNAEPVLTGDPVFKATITCTFRTLEDFTFFTAAAAGTAYKASFQITGDVISGAKSYYTHFNFPYVKILDDPTHTVGSVSDNEHTVVFEALMAASAPTGMISTYPYVMVQNDRSTAFLTV